MTVTRPARAGHVTRANELTPYVLEGTCARTVRTVRAYRAHVPSLVCVPREMDGERVDEMDGGPIAPPLTRRRLVMQPMPRWILLPRLISRIVCICIVRSKCW